MFNGKLKLIPVLLNGSNYYAHDGINQNVVTKMDEP